MLTDVTPYRKYVDQFDISEEKKLELIHSVWNMMQSVVDEAFGKHPAQLVKSDSSKPLQKSKPSILSLVEPNRSGASKLRNKPGA